jgi:coenzyme F420-reducing hydrogenase gamma subunit
MKSVASTLLAIGLCAAYGTAERMNRNSGRHPADQQVEDDNNSRGTRRGWLPRVFRRR